MPNPKLAMKAMTAASQAHTNLNTFATIVSILEGGHLYGHTSNDAARRIIEICKREQAACLARYDTARAAVEHLAGGPTE